MGGFSSGRTAYATTPSDRECLKLSITEFTDTVKRDAVASGTCEWGSGDRGPSLRWSTIDGAGREGIQLNYTVRTGGEMREKQYPVWITYTECNFGGERAWWTCPNSGCGERAEVLYLPPGEGMFSCRHCHDFGYVSSRASGNVDRTLRLRYNRVREKLDAEPCHPNSWDSDVPDRPKGMHQDTYEDLLADLREARLEWEEKALMQPLREQNDRLVEVD